MGVFMKYVFVCCLQTFKETRGISENHFIFLLNMNLAPKTTSQQTIADNMNI